MQIKKETPASIKLMLALTSDNPENIFREWAFSGLDVDFPEIFSLKGIPQVALHHPEVDTFEHVMLALRIISQWTEDPITRFAVLVHDLGKGTTPTEELPRHFKHEERGVDIVINMCERIGLPNNFKQAGVDASLFHLKIHRLFEIRRPGKIVKLLSSLNVFDSLERINRLSFVCEADARGRKGLQSRDYRQAQIIRDIAKDIHNNPNEAIDIAQTYIKKFFIS